MKNKIPYLNQYYNLEMEWKRNNKTIDNASKKDADTITKLRAKAIEESGLNCSEVSLICNCRKNNALSKVLMYSYSKKRN